MKIGISNLKGGVGKTTIAQNLAVCFAHMGYKVCIVDTDTNQNSLAWSGVRDENLPEILVVGAIDSKALNKTVDKLHNDHEIIIIDGTPSLSEMTTRIILASDILLIPILPSGHDFRAMNQFFERYEQAKAFRENIPAYFILNQFSENLNVHQDMKNLLKDFGMDILKTSLNKRVAYVKTGIEGKGVYESNDEKAKEEMVRLTQEVVEIALPERVFAAVIHGRTRNQTSSIPIGGAHPVADKQYDVPPLTARQGKRHHRNRPLVRQGRPVRGQRYG